MHHQLVTINNDMAVRTEPLVPNHASPAADKHNSLSHSATAETEFDLCLGQRSELYIQVAPGDPQSSHPLVACVCVSPHPGSSPGPGKSLGHTDTDLSSATLRLIPDFMGAKEGGRVRALRPAGAS